MWASFKDHQWRFGCGTQTTIASWLDRICPLEEASCGGLTGARVGGAEQDGAGETGVSVAFTVRAMDAGPVLAQHVVRLSGEEQAPALLQSLFQLGTRLLLDRLDCVWDGLAPSLAIPQDPSQVLPPLPACPPSPACLRARACVGRRRK